MVAMPETFRPWEAASAVFFVYTAVVAVALPRLAPQARRRALAIGLGGLGLTLASAALPHVVALHDWLIPPTLLLLGYWAGGFVFVAPMPGAERALMAGDTAAGVRALSARAPRFVAEFLEFAYAGVYPLIPIALIIHLASSPEPDPERFWTVILVTDYVCFGVLPWVQTRPPRALEDGEPWRADFRRVNLRLLGTASIHVNTFPSGHAAEALAAALLVVGAPLPAVVWMFFNAAAVSAGAVFGRYHYAADAVAGWIVAVVVWGILS